MRFPSWIYLLGCLLLRKLPNNFYHGNSPSRKHKYIYFVSCYFQKTEGLTEACGGAGQDTTQERRGNEGEAILLCPRTQDLSVEPVNLSVTEPLIHSQIPRTREQLHFQLITLWTPKRLNHRPSGDSATHLSPSRSEGAQETAMGCPHPRQTSQRSPLFTPNSMRSPKV